MDSECGTTPEGRGRPTAEPISGPRRIRTGRRSIAVTDPDRVLFPETGTTKADLVEYYRRVSRELLPHVRGRPLVVENFPNGVGGEGLRWIEPPEWFPPWVERHRLRSGETLRTHIVLNRAPTVLYLVEHGMVTPYTWMSRVERPTHPDRMTFEVDPQDGGDFDAVRAASEALRGVLERLNLASFPMTSGLSGIHVVVPLTGRDSFGTVRRFAHAAAEMAALTDPGRIGVPADEGGEAGPTAPVVIRTDRNGYGRAAVAPYAVRGRPRAPVATPFFWSDLDKVYPGRFTVANLLDRLASEGDPWREMRRFSRSLSRARKPL